MHSVAIVRVVSRIVELGRSCESLTLDLCGRLGQHGNVGSTAVVVDGRVGESKSRIRVGRRDVGRGQCRTRSRADGLGRGRRRHHPLEVHVVREALLVVNLVVLLLVLSGLVTSP